MAWDKSVAKYLFAEAGIPTPPWITLTADAFKEMGAASVGELCKIVDREPLEIYRTMHALREGGLISE